MMFSTILAIAVLLCAVEATANERRLRNDLFAHYDKWTRPVQNSEDAVDVTLGFMPRRALKFERENEVLHLSLWVSLRWKDYALQWDPSPEEYNMTTIRMPSKMIWMPDIVPYGASQKVEPVFPVSAIVYNTGDVMYVASYHLTFPCGPTETADEFECREKFGSWVYHGQEINPNVETQEIDLSTLRENIPNRSVDVISGSTRKISKQYSCCVETYPNHEAIFRIKIG